MLIRALAYTRIPVRRYGDTHMRVLTYTHARMHAYMQICRYVEYADMQVPAVYAHAHRHVHASPRYASEHAGGRRRRAHISVFAWLREARQPTDTALLPRVPTHQRTNAPHTTPCARASPVRYVCHNFQCCCLFYVAPVYLMNAPLMCSAIFSLLLAC
jgi:hypothetical protein